MTTPIALTIAGSDSGGGAGIQADLKTFSALGVYGASVITALTAQNTQGVTGVLDVPADFVRAQMDAVFGDLDIGAVKIGMLSQPETIRAVAEGLAAYRPPVVVLDPVMVAKSGDALLQPEAVETLVRSLLPLATLITPNLPEAARILDRAPVADASEMTETARALLQLGPEAVLLKGGHLEAPVSPDVLVHAGGVEQFDARRVTTKNTHGTGCTLSSAIAAFMARGLPLVEAVAEAKAYLTAAIEAADDLSIGHGQGPVHHFHALWPQKGRTR